jgi:disulfide oxidoreductase YuzD
MWSKKVVKRIVKQPNLLIKIMYIDKKFNNMWSKKIVKRIVKQPNLFYHVILIEVYQQVIEKASQLYCETIELIVVKTS